MGDLVQVIRKCNIMNDIDVLLVFYQKGYIINVIYKTKRIYRNT